MNGGPGEPQAVAERYARRTTSDLYSPLRPDVCRLLQERQRALLGLFAAAGIVSTASLQATEVGCGSGGNLLELLQLGLLLQDVRTDQHPGAQRQLLVAGGDDL